MGNKTWSNRLEYFRKNRLIERKYGKIEGLTKEKIQEMNKNNPDMNEIWNYNKNVDLKNIETMKCFYNRIYNFLDDITEKYKNKKILIVTHGGVTIPVKCYFMNYPLENLKDRNGIRGLENCEVIKFSI